MNNRQDARIDSMTTDAANMPNKKAEKTRGFKEGFGRFELLRAKWPKAFPQRSQDVRPLTNHARQALAEEFGWSPGYAQGVLVAWTMRYAYCQAILRYPTRINLDGSASDEEVGDQPRALAKTQLERHAARKAEKAKGTERDRLRAATEASAEPKAPDATPAPASVSDAKPAPAAPEPPKSGKLLVAGSAAMQAALKRRLSSGGTMTTEVLKTVPVRSPNRRRKQQA